MQEKNQILWKNILSEIETEISKANFLTLFKGTSLLTFDQNIMTVSAPSIMIIDLIQKRFYDNVKKACDKHTKSDTTIIFVPKTSLPKEEVKDGPLFAFESKPSAIGHLPRVRPDYTFENLAVSASNQLAYVSCLAVAKKMGLAYNPLFIYGPVGVGKTHLMQAIANEVYKNDPTKKILYITSEEFTNEVVEAIRTNDTARMKRRFRSLDLLIIDDIQFLAGKERVQEELFHTFNFLVDKASQIVLSSDRPPAEIRKIEKRLSSRFSGGLTVDVDSPDFELRTAILLIKAKKFGFDLPIEVAKSIAEKTQDTRALEGLLLRVMTETGTTGTIPDQDRIDGLLTHEEQKTRFRPDEIIRNTCVFYNVKPTQLKSSKRDARLVRARQVCMYLLKKEVGLTFAEIGNLLGGRDHTTIMHGVTKIEELIVSSKLSEDILGITKLEKTSPVDF